MKVSIKIILIYILGGVLLLFTTIFAYKTFGELDKYSAFISEALNPINEKASDISQNSVHIYNCIERESLGGQKASKQELYRLLEKIASDSAYLKSKFQDIVHIKRSSEVKENIESLVNEVNSFKTASNLIINTLEQSTGVGSQSDIEFDKLYDEIVEDLRKLSSKSEFQSSKLQSEIGDARYLLAHGHLLTAEILSGDEGEDFKEVSDSFSKALQRVSNLSIAFDEKVQFEKEILKLTGLAQQRYSTMVNLREKKEGSLNIFENSYKKFNDNIKKLTHLLNEEIREQNKLFAKSKSKAQKTMLFISIAAVLTVVIIILYLYKNIFMPFSSLIHTIKHFKFTEEIPGLNRTDELGAMAQVLEDLRQIEAENKALNHVINAHSLISVTDTRGKISSANEQFCKISQYEEDELIGKDHRILNSGTHSKEFMKEMWDTIKSGGVWQGEICNKAKDGSLYWVDATITSYKNAQGKIEKFVAVRTDITDKKNHENQIISAKVSAEEANKAKSQFLANMSHEIRTPLNSIIGYSDILTEEELPSDVNNMVKSIKTNSQTLLELVNDVLDLAKIESGELELELMEVDINEILYSTSKAQVSKIGQKALQINIDTAKINPHVISDQLRLKQVFINIVGNAIKFTEEGEIFIKAETVTSTADKQKVKFSISDTGIGMTKKQCKNIFKAFRQADGSTTRKYGGTGLGLNITKKILEKMGSSIKVESTVGEGTNFYFEIEFPLAKEKVAPEINFEVVKDKAVLVMDKNQNAQKIFSGYLGKNTKKLHLAADFDEASKILSKDAIDLFIVDQNTFTESSKLSLSEISDKYQNLNVIGITTTISQESINKLKTNNVSTYLTKPIKEDELLEALSSFMDQKVKPELKKDSEIKESDIRILVVDDNPSNLKLADKIFTKMGYAVAVAESGEEAVNTLDKEDFNIVFMDMQMPNMSGPEATKILRSKGLETPIIALTANAFNSDREECLNSGMNDFTTKPLKRNELNEIIQKYTS